MKLTRSQWVDAAAGLAVFALGAGGYYASLSIRVTRGSVSASTGPKLCAAVIALLGLVLTAVSLLKKNRSGGEEVSPLAGITLRGGISFALVTGIFLGYALALRTLGFTAGTFLLVLSLMLVLAPPGERKPVRFALISAAAVGCIYAIFVLGFRVMLPAGVLGF